MDLGSPRHEFKRSIRIFNENVAQSEDEKLPEKCYTPLSETYRCIHPDQQQHGPPRSVAGVLGHASQYHSQYICLFL